MHIFTLYVLLAFCSHLHGKRSKAVVPNLWVGGPWKSQLVMRNDDELIRKWKNGQINSSFILIVFLYFNGSPPSTQIQILIF